MHGHVTPKPLIDLAGRPFFWWAVESVRRVVKLRQLVFVVLQEHVAEFSIDQKIAAYYPDAAVVALPDVTSGAAETAAAGLAALSSSGPVAINDCDHAFICPSLGGAVDALQGGRLEAALMCFRSSSPAYSYAQIGPQGEVIGTVEKQPVSPFAIAGCYLFAGAERYRELYERYRHDCPYDEMFVSGLFNQAAQRHLPMGMLELERHCSFGTPEELKRLTAEQLAPFQAWK